MELALSCGWVVLIAWLVGRAIKQRDLFPAIEPCAGRGTLPHVAIIIPVRDEEANIADCLQTFMGQSYQPDNVQIIVIDDHSSDATLAIANSLARGCSRISVLQSPPLPPHWVGKVHACWLGALAVDPQVEWLCFIDADVRAEPALLVSALAVARSEGLDLLSLAPRQRLVGFADRLIIPCGLFLMSLCQDLQKVQAERGDKVTATGQFILIRRDVYRAIGTHAAVHDAICEDVALALLVKRTGGQTVLRNGKLLLSAQMYSGWSSLWTGISKNLVQMLGGERHTLILALGALAVSSFSLLVPAMASLGCVRGQAEACLALVPAIAGSAAAFGLHLAATFYFGIPIWYGLLFPLGYTIGAFIAVDSVRRHRTHRILWKGRTYP
jgi:chlorobactene glucosyltransferase